MPSFEPQEDDFKLIIAFKTEELREEFISKHSIKMTSKTKNTWSTRVPFKERGDRTKEIFE